MWRVVACRCTHVACRHTHVACRCTHACRHTHVACRCTDVAGRPEYRACLYAYTSYIHFYPCPRPCSPPCLQACPKTRRHTVYTHVYTHVNTHVNTHMRGRATAYCHECVVFGGSSATSVLCLVGALPRVCCVCWELGPLHGVAVTLWHMALGQDCGAIVAYGLVGPWCMSLCMAWCGRSCIWRGGVKCTWPGRVPVVYGLVFFFVK